MQYATGGLVEDKPIICGGWVEECCGNDYFETSCYVYQKYTKEWKFLTHMNDGRGYFASAVVNNSLWVTGGYGDSVKKIDSTEFIQVDGTVVVGPNLPNPTSGHCMVTLPDKRHNIYILDSNTLAAL